MLPYGTARAAGSLQGAAMLYGTEICVMTHFRWRREEKEKDEKRDFSHGLLAHLEWLEFRARREAAEQEKRERREERREFLLSKIRELRERRHRLREKLGEAGKAGIPRIPKDPDPPDPREVLEWKIRNCRDLIRIFRLTGISGNLSHPGISFSFHTSFEGSFLDSFQLEFQEFRHFRIRRHSIPPFIPLELLARQFLPRNLREFLGILFQHLNAFVARRQQL
ncbi:PREDICTED: centromere protein O, partial [Pseudopodoces humilis]|uniref:centromere protein O n=1 Tax=Pseudopodoces humilis TaxID=181119 RepID=UPI0006B7E5FB